jgi:hypothetical protein
MATLRLSSVVSSLALTALLAAASGMALAQGMGSELKLTGDQEVPANASTAVGTGHIMIAADGAVSGSVSAPTLQGIAAHIHVGAAGVNGPVIVPLTAGPNGVWSVPAGAKLTAEQLDAYKAGGLYVNVHTAEHKGGEIRTQLTP